MKTAIVIPAHNEEETISSVILKAKKYGDVIVVDDASTDETDVISKKCGAIVLTHTVNKGLGGALRSGFNKALELKYDAVITLDADGQHDPADIPKFLGKIKQNYDFVLGKRDISKYPIVKKFGNLFLNMATNAVAGTSLKDTESGFRAFKGTALKKLTLKAEKYEIAAEIILEVGKNKLKACNVDVSSPVYKKGVNVFEGVKNFVYLLKK